MKICNSCGGVIGRDCFNPSECEWIRHQQEMERQRKLDVLLKVPAQLGKERCDDCGTELIDSCLICGAPVCCPKCCARATLSGLN